MHVTRRQGGASGGGLNDRRGLSATVGALRLRLEAVTDDEQR